MKFKVDLEDTLYDLKAVARAMRSVDHPDLWAETEKLETCVDEIERLVKHIPQNELLEMLAFMRDRFTGLYNGEPASDVLTRSILSVRSLMDENEHLKEQLNAIRAVVDGEK